ncbi:MAG: hypothetical protein R6T92_01785 [Desulfosalsimonadaceae bacterium]
MFLINREAVIIKGKQPLVDWVNSHDPENPLTLSDVREECTVILLPECRDKEEAVTIIESNFEVLFSGEMEGWIADESLWPKDVTLATFREWFDVEYHSMVFDALEDDIEKREE